jgi:hypothetical protein
VRPMGPGDGKRASSKLIGHDSIEMTFAVAELLSKTRYAVAFDSAICNQAHCPTNQILTQIPLRRAGRRVRPTPLACSEAALLCSSGRVMELDVRLLRRNRRTTRAAIDPCRANRSHEPPVEAPVGVLNNAVAMVVIEGWHASMMPVTADKHQRKSASQVDV